MAGRIRWFLGVGLLGLAAAGAWYGRRPVPVAVVAQPVERGTVERTVANTRAGTVKACRRALLSPALGGQIAALNIHEGDRVKAGDLLLELWNADLRAEMVLNQAEVTATTATARAACLHAEVARREADRSMRLKKSGGVSEEALDKLVTEAQASLADCEAANTRILVSEAKLAVAQSQLERTRLTAPFEGVIAEVNAELHEYVTPSPPGIPTPPAVDLIDASCFYVAAPIDEVDAPKVQLGQTARVSMDAFGDRRFPAVVRRIAPYVLDREKQARTVEVEVEFSNPEDRAQLLAGYSADVEVVLERREGMLRVPTQAVVEEKRLYLLNTAAGKIEERTVEVGISNWDHTELLSGVNEGELAITSVDREGVKDGAPAVRDESAEK